jgi:hypothetical protein
VGAGTRPTLRNGEFLQLAQIVIEYEEVFSIKSSEYGLTDRMHHRTDSITRKEYSLTEADRTGHIIKEQATTWRCLRFKQPLVFSRRLHLEEKRGPLFLRCLQVPK